MKKIFTFFALLVFISALHAQVSTSPSLTTEAIKSADLPKTSDQVATLATPEPLIIKELEYDFGKIPQGKAVTHVFEVSNGGKTPLVISNITASCGCTTPEWEKDKPLAFGESTKITVGYNAAAEGVFTKQITINYNQDKVKVITIKGEVWKTPNASAPENNAANDLKN